MPYTGDRNLSLPPTTIISDLIEQVISASPQPSSTPQCIVHSGRILPDTSTLAENGISQGAVLHLMRRPSESARRRRRHQEEHHHEHEHEHDHFHTNVLIGHIAVDGRVRFDDAYDVLMSVLHAVGFSTTAVHTASSVAAAVAVAMQSAQDRGGASQTVLRNAWTAVYRLQQGLIERNSAVSSETSPRGAGPIRGGTEEDQERSGPDAQPTEREQGDDKDAVMEETHEVDDEKTVENVAGTMDITPPASTPALTEATTVKESTSPTEATAVKESTSPTEDTALADTEAQNEVVRLMRSGPAWAQPEVERITSSSPAVRDGQSALDASAEATDRLLPILAFMLEDVADAIRNAPTLVNVEGTPRVLAAERIMRHLAGVASAATTVTTLVSSVLPPEEPNDVGESGSDSGPRPRHRTRRGPRRSASRGRRHGNPRGERAGASGTESNGDAGTTTGEGRDGDLGADATRSTDPSGNAPSQPDSAPGNQSSQAQDSGPGNRPEGRDDADSSDRHGGLPAASGRVVFNSNNEAEIEITGFFGTPSMNGAMGFLQELTSGMTRINPQEGSGPDGSRPSGENRRSAPHSGTSMQTTNADFMIRVLSYYLHSFMDHPSDESLFTVEDSDTAVSVLDGLFGQDGASVPSNVFLQLAHMVMQKMKPSDFHSVCRGDFQSLVSFREDIWKAMKEHLHNMASRPVEELDIEPLFIDVVCDSVHEFVHRLERIHQRNQALDSFGLDEGEFCHQVMYLVQEKVVTFLDILTSESSDELAALQLHQWLINSVGDILRTIQVALNADWDELLATLRRALHVVGMNVVGNEISVIFPFLANVFAVRAKAALENAVTRISAERGRGHPRQTAPDSDFDHSNCGPYCARRQAMCDGHSSGDEHDDDDSCSDIPGLSESDPDADDYDDDGCDDEHDGEDYFDDNYDDCSNEDGDDSLDDSDLFPDGSDGNDINDIVTRSKRDRENTVGIDLNDDELADLGKELVREIATGGSSEGGINLDEIVGELVTEQSPSSGQGDPVQSTRSLPSNSQRPTARRMPGMAFSSAAAFRRPGMSGTAASMFSGSSVGRAAFSSATVPRSATAERSARSGDEFDVLASRDSSSWRKIVEQDEKRISGRKHGPLSRGYRGKKSGVPPLNEESAANFAVEAAREAARKAGLSEGRAQELERVASENGEQYLQEMERAVRSRLESDPDYERERFPNITSRFLSS